VFELLVGVGEGCFPEDQPSEVPAFAPRSTRAHRGRENNDSYREFFWGEGFWPYNGGTITFHTICNHLENALLVIEDRCNMGLPDREGFIHNNGCKMVRHEMDL